MKIVYIGCRSLDAIGGIENYMKHLCPLLAAKGHEVILYVESDRYEVQNRDGVKVVSLPSLNSKFLNKIIISFLSTLHSLVTDRDVDIYHFNAIPSAFFSFLPIMLKRHVVYQGHGFEWKRAKWSSSIQKLVKKMESAVIAINRNFTMVSGEQSEYISTFGKESVTITPGVTIQNLDLDSDVLDRYALERNGYFLFLGRLVPEKRADVLIGAYQALGGAGVKLVIAGDDPNEARYIQGLKLMTNGDPNVVFTGAVYGDDKEVLLQQCRAFCIPSELEGLPITLLEAMRYAKVCIASDIPANREALGDCGLFFRVNDMGDLSAWLWGFLREEGQYDHLKQCAYQRVANLFTWEIIADRMALFYNSIIGK